MKTIENNTEINSINIRKNFIIDTIEKLQIAYGTDTWKYRFIKDAKNIGLTVQFKQLKEMEKGLSKNADILICMLVILRMKNERVRLDITKTGEIKYIITNPPV